MKKTLALVLAILMAVSLLSACSKTPADATTTPSTTEGTKPADTKPFTSASSIVLPTPKTSPVDFISGPRLEFASSSFSKEKTGTLTAKYGGVL